MSAPGSKAGSAGYDLRYAEVYSADNVKIGCLARVQDLKTGRFRVDVGGFLTVHPTRMTLPLAHLSFHRDQDDVVFASAVQTKAACLALLKRQQATAAAEPSLSNVVVRWWGVNKVRPIYSRH